MRVRLLASLKEQAGVDVLEVDARNWREALRKIRDNYGWARNVLAEDGSPRPGYLVFVDGVDYRLREPEYRAREIVILPVNHGGGRIEVKFVTWDEIERLVDSISREVEESGFQPHVVVGIIRGGMIPARLIADRLNVDTIATMELKLYKGVGLRGERPYIRQPLTLELVGKRVLIVDDVSDTGLTLQHAVQAVNLYMPSEVRTATLYIKPWTDYRPDYHGPETDRWIVFPWEKREYEKEVASRGV